ncbi:MAG: hypothetical protein N2C12_15600, partial [Planctomycetales bacterium]
MGQSPTVAEQGNLVVVGIEFALLDGQCDRDIFVCSQGVVHQEEVLCLESITGRTILFVRVDAAALGGDPRPCSI